MTPILAGQQSSLGQLSRKTIASTQDNSCVSAFGIDREATTKWSWSCRMVDPSSAWRIRPIEDHPLSVGDVAVVEIASVGNHTRIVTAANERLRLYPGDRFVGVFGNRYATDAFEAVVGTADRVHILTNAGMLGTVRSRHSSVMSPTMVRCHGLVTDQRGKTLNLKSRLFKSSWPESTARNVVFVVGTGMNSGKTTTATRLVKGLVNQGVRVVACKLTGSVSHRDLFELRSTSPARASDFSDYGFPSTYLCSSTELSDLFHTMVADAHCVNPDIVIMEIADGVLQRETAMLLRDEEIGKHVAGVLLTAPCALSAIQGVHQVHLTGHRVLGVSGIISNSPLFEKEFRQHCEVPVYSSSGLGEQLSAGVLQFVQVEPK